MVSTVQYPWAPMLETSTKPWLSGWIMAFIFNDRTFRGTPVWWLRSKWPVSGRIVSARTEACWATWVLILIAPMALSLDDPIYVQILNRSPFIWWVSIINVSTSIVKDPLLSCKKNIWSSKAFVLVRSSRWFNMTQPLTCSHWNFMKFWGFPQTTPRFLSPREHSTLASHTPACLCSLFSRRDAWQGMGQ